MKKNLTLSVPQPCAEDWNSFAPTATGGFCGQCSKNVIDFTKATDAEVLEFIKNKPEHACGRFRARQLKTYQLTNPALRPGFTLVKAGVMGLLLILISKPATAQTASSKTKTEIIQQPKNLNITSVNAAENRITGRITSSEDGSPLPGVSVVQQGTAYGTQTNEDGRFELMLDLDRGKILVFSFIGLMTERFTIENPSAEIKIVMNPDETTLGGLVIITGEVSATEPYAEKQSFFQKTWSKIKNVFSRG